MAIPPTLSVSKLVSYTALTFPPIDQVSVSKVVIHPVLYPPNTSVSVARFAQYVVLRARRQSVVFIVS